jgi:hypothetical protein
VFYLDDGIHRLDDRGLFRKESTPLAPEQLALRKQVYKQAVAEPDRFDMNDWERRYRYPNGSCSTTRCAAGWAQFLARGAVYPEGDEPLGIPPVDDDAIVLLGLTEAEYNGGHDADEGLFYLEDDEAVERLRKLAREN